MPATIPTFTAVRAALLQARADLDDALDLLDEVGELPAEVAERVFGGVEGLAEGLGEMANATGPRFFLWRATGRAAECEQKAPAAL